MDPDEDSGWLARARAQWRWRGAARPDFAHVPGPGQESVWDYPRPPVLREDGREVRIDWAGTPVARTCRAIRVLETAHPPTFYLPREDLEHRLLRAEPGASLCEWKGRAQYWSLDDGHRRLARIAWSYPDPLPGARPLKDHVAFYTAGLHCTVGGQPVSPQPGGFYGGWVTPELVGPFKGEPGSKGW